jgi:hypothetical protein
MKSRLTSKEFRRVDAINKTIKKPQFITPMSMQCSTQVFLQIQWLTNADRWNWIINKS